MTPAPACDAPLEVDVDDDDDSASQSSSGYCGTTFSDGEYSSDCDAPFRHADYDCTEA
jgi:hypothetical protein